MTTSRRTRGVLQLVGWIGLIGCLALATGILLVRGAIGDAIAGVATAADSALQDGADGLSTATVRLNDGADELDLLIVEIEGVGAGQLPPAVQARVAALADGAAAARDRLSGARSQIESAVAVVASIAGRVPGVTVPEPSGDRLAALDARLAELDAKLADLRAAAAGSPEAALVAVRGAQGVVVAAAESAGDAEATIAGLQAQVDETAATIERWTWFGAIGILGIVAYIALLNGLVIWLARRP